MNSQSEIDLDTDASAIDVTATATPSGGLEQRIFAARVRLLYSGIGLTAAVNVTNATILAVVYRNMVGGGMVLGWLAFMATSILWRIWLVGRFRTAAPADGAMGNWAQRYMLGSLWTGSAWGLAAIFMLPEAAPAYQIVAVGVLGGSAAGAVTTLTRHYPAYLAFVLPALAPVAVHFARAGGETGYGMAVMSALFLIFLLHAGRKQSDALEQSLRLSMENQGLVDHLTEEKARAGQLNAELRREMTEREKIDGDLREREASLANAQRIAGLGSWRWNIRTNEIRGSNEAYRIFAIDRATESITFDQFMGMVHPDDRDAVTQAIAASFKDGTIYSVVHRAMLADGTIRVVHERGEMEFDENGEAAVMTGTAHDITEQHRILQELEAAKSQAEDGSRAKSQFLANMSHEFRTPLNAIIGYSEILKEDAVEAGQAESSTDLDRINAAGRHLLALVNEVLDLSKIEAGRMELYVEHFDIAELVGELVSTVRPLAVKNGNELSVDCAPDLGRMAADATKVRQILYNLLSNAAKFTEQGRIAVAARRLEEPGTENHGGWIVFTVTDNGIGMARDRIAAAFLAFDQLDPSTTRKYGGTGLGLAISRHYCEMMGGAISAESEPGRGSVFTVRLPADVGASCTSATAVATD
ncbi:MAG: PAS domain-containing protein [Proteobacteria bacterium]|nr:PAS domain-containing protein [Pseudomonadota bacterium]